MTSNLSIEGLFAKAWIQLDLNLSDCASDTMDQIIAQNPKLTRSQQELFENIHKKRLAPYRNILHSEDNELVQSDGDLQLIGFVKEDAFKKLEECVNYAVTKLNDVLIPSASDDKSRIFYYRIKADYYRYLAEFTAPESDQTPFEESRKSYANAMSLAVEKLEATDPILLGIVLNYSLFIANFMNDEKEAVELAGNALSEYYKRNEEREEVNEHDATEEAELINSIEKNVNMWKKGDEKNENEEGEDEDLDE